MGAWGTPQHSGVRDGLAAEQNQLTLQLLVDLGDEGRGLLERRARRMNSTQRAALRDELLALPNESRLSFLGAD